MKEKIWTIISIVAFVLQVAAEALTGYIVLQMNILPSRFVIVMIAALVLLAIPTGLLLFLRVKKSISTTRRIIAYILVLLVVCGCALVTKVAADAYNTLHAVTKPNETPAVVGMCVLVRADDPAQTLQDAANYEFAVVQDFDSIRMQRMQEMLEETLNKTLTPFQYETAAAVADALLAGDVDAVILSEAMIALLSEEADYVDFIEKVRVLYSVPLDQLQESQPTTQPDTNTTEKTVVTAPFVVYISGSDTRNNKLKISRSDVNILAIVNPQSKQILLLNTPRDYYIPNPAGNGALDKLTHCGLYGPECSMEALGDLYGMEIDYYAHINFTGLETLVDAVGGVTVYADHSFTSDNGIHFTKGENELNGEQALAFARERHHVSGGDNGRGRNQMKVITALIKKATTGTTIISRYAEILKSLEGMFRTTLSTEEISMLVKMQLNDMASWNVQSFAVTGKGGSEKTYTSPGHNAYVMHPNKDVVAYASQLVQKVLDGEVLTEADMTVPKK